MIRTQIQLTEAQLERLKRLAAERGVSIAAIVREAVDRLGTDSERHARRQRALSVVGKYRSDGAGDIAERHDEYLADAFLA